MADSPAVRQIAVLHKVDNRRLDLLRLMAQQCNQGRSWDTTLPEPLRPDTYCPDKHMEACTPAYMRPAEYNSVRDSCPSPA
ncbi:hypothetical protein D3C80_1587320 [compost metagenome]